jgi:hypothetical protein
MSTDPILPAVLAPNPLDHRIDAAAAVLEGHTRDSVYMLTVRAWGAGDGVHTGRSLDTILAVPGAAAALVAAGLLEEVDGWLRAVVVKRVASSTKRTREYRQRKRSGIDAARPKGPQGKATTGEKTTKSNRLGHVQGSIRKHDVVARLNPDGVIYYTLFGGKDGRDYVNAGSGLPPGTPLDAANLLDALNKLLPESKGQKPKDGGYRVPSLAEIEAAIEAAGASQRHTASHAVTPRHTASHLSHDFGPVDPPQENRVETHPEIETGVTLGPIYMSSYVCKEDIHRGENPEPEPEPEPGGGQDDADPPDAATPQPAVVNNVAPAGIPPLPYAATLVPPELQRLVFGVAAIVAKNSTAKEAAVLQTFDPVTINTAIDLGLIRLTTVQGERVIVLGPGC